MAPRPWNALPIRDCGEPLQALPARLHCLEPHPYQRLGAPYGVDASPFQVRSGVVQRLLAAQSALERRHPQWCLAIFDGWRPLAVQAFMVEHTIAELCRVRGVDRAAREEGLAEIVAEVGRFWAPPNPDPAAPPPHSTGAAVDLTLAERRDAGPPVGLDMGSAIDAIGAVSEPDHFAALAEATSDLELCGQYRRWQERRCLLRSVLAEQGFAQHPNEWWHFSWGDQLWAWRQGKSEACYGRVDGELVAGREDPLV